MKQNKEPVSEGLACLIAANEPLWGGEAEVIRSYFEASTRTPETDRKWLIHQIYKEYWHGVLPSLDEFTQHLPNIRAHNERSSLLEVAGVLHDEARHFSLLAGLFHTLAGVDFELSAEQLKTRGRWREDDALMSARAQHRLESAELGRRAYRITEGGFCALFREGMRRNGCGPFDNALAEVCSRICDDELNHMLLGIVGLDDASMSEADWDTLTRFSTEQMKLRIVMRNAQFSHPVSSTRLDQLCAGSGAPLEFDFERATTLMG